MKTQNEYSYPIEKEHIQKILTKESPAHRKYKDKNGTVYDLTHAVDFLCNEGTPVKAALDGTVVKIINNLTINYNKYEPPTEDILPIAEQDGNYVLIKHSKNEFSIYSHLKNGSISVKIGQNVKTGEIIGYSGNTGWSIKPHLHFMIFRFLNPQPAKDLESLEIRWK
ncbi:MAG: M23 family metallopeptidase [Candidatus Aenigmatarchaeota archaeon]